ncbi:TAXI family TRAP transporter solute-binding subunit [Amycolatopsis taiwanensis]|uniref:C4-dicarboxylate ABC transporter substrate-binding protein n=1 Tax=Amycolatopsis taiwanensis TaxID=342230 RepID=A0A9W6VGE1_9PSEU|nr:TAXI family TRAP transporter solute-binding subunit [Amycolatopsis taiwanensis]GLY67685.1 C4-dicarboxylate ABC transporter substrate-binding protein [Amycolatopsis taiwanensis]
MIRRRTLLLAGLTASAGLVGSAPLSDAGPVGQVRIATGEQTAFYLAFGQLLATELQAAYPRLRCIALPTEASVANLTMLDKGEAELALTLADIAEDALTGNTSFSRPVALRALGRVYENYLQLAVRADSTITSVPQLAGRTISLSAPGSGAAAMGSRLVSAAGLTDVRILHLSMAEAHDALSARTIDAMLVSGGVPLPILSTLDDEIGIRILPLSPFLPAMRRAGQTAYESVLLPPGAYRGGSEVDTIGSANLLVCRPDLAEDVAAAVTRVLAQRAGDLVPAQAVGTQFLDVRSLISTGAVPLHPGAVTAYRSLHG